MISIVEHSPPDPSSSNYQNHHLHHQQQVSHEAFASVSDIDLLNPTDAAINLDDTNNQIPNFSIRDYVYGSRCNNDIACNWPFSRKSLQLCLIHGVKNLLPPFQSLDSLRTNCADQNRLRNELNVSCVIGKSTNGQCNIDEDLAYTKSTKSTPAFEKMVKKCKFVTKLNSSVESVQEVNPNSFTVSETMASKVCPVCKTFSSSSNTTLNAHIDRCLFEESSVKQTASQKIVTFKHRIKTRTTRLLVDIYKTAPRCTIEELDRRNGTSWATNSSFPDQEFEFQAEKETKENRQEPTFVREVADRDGSVYIDKNGKKVRILSMPTFTKFDDREARKLQKRGKTSKIIAEKKKKYVKNLKLSTNSKKATSGVEDSCNEIGSDKSMKDRVSTEIDDLMITRPPWACSKRTRIAKKRSPALTTPKVIEQPRDRCVSMENNVNVPSQNTLVKKLRPEDYTERKLSSETVCVREFDNCFPFQGSFMGLTNTVNDNVMIENNTEDLTEPLKKDDDYFVEVVETIPIPGPPGSFLPPSPGADMVSEEELQENSTLTSTMSRVHSSEDRNHDDVMNRDFISESPISTISSPVFAISFEKLSNDIGDLKPLDAIRTENEPCPSAYYRQESRKRDLELNRRDDSTNFRSDLFPLPPETVKSSVKLPDYRDGESVGPTTPVLRLMGKNLTVVNTNDEQFRPPCSLSPLISDHIKNENRNSFFYDHPVQRYVNQNQNVFVPQYSDIRPPDNSTSLFQSRPVDELRTMFTSARNIVSSSSFTPMHNLRGFGNYRYGNRGVSPVFREVMNNENVSTETGSPLASTAYQELMKFQVYDEF